MSELLENTGVQENRHILNAELRMAFLTLGLIMVCALANSNRVNAQGPEGQGGGGAGEQDINEIYNDIGLYLGESFLLGDPPLGQQVLYRSVYYLMDQQGAGGSPPQQQNWAPDIGATGVFNGTGNGLTINPVEAAYNELRRQVDGGAEQLVNNPPKMFSGGTVQSMFDALKYGSQQGQ